MSQAQATQPIPQSRRQAHKFSAWHAVWCMALIAFVLLWQFGKPLVPWAFKYPTGLRVPFRRWIGDFMKGLVAEASFGLFTFKAFSFHFR